MSLSHWTQYALSKIIQKGIITFVPMFSALVSREVSGEVKLLFNPMLKVIWRHTQKNMN